MSDARFVLVRHGEARAGVDRIIGGDKGCRGLTDTGRAQAVLLRDRLARTGELRPDVIYTSTLPRAVETAEIVSEAFPHITEIRHDLDLREQIPGICDGMYYPDAMALYAPDRDGPDVPMSPGGESARDLDARVGAVMQRLVDAHPHESVMIVSHGGFISTACMCVLGLPGFAERYPWRLSPSNTSLTEFVPDAPHPPWNLKRYNDNAHLLEGS